MAPPELGVMVVVELRGCLEGMERPRGGAGSEQSPQNRTGSHPERESRRFAALNSAVAVQTLSPSALIRAGMFQEHFCKALS